MTHKLSLRLGFGFSFSDLYSVEGVHRLQETFESYVKEISLDLYYRYQNAITQSSSSANSDLLIDLAPLVEDFFAQLFRIQGQLQALQDAHQVLAPLWRVKRQFVQRYALRRYKLKDIENFDPIVYRQNFEEAENVPFSDLSFAHQISIWLLNEEQYLLQREAAAQYCVWAVETDEGQRFHAQSPLFKVPKKLNFDRLVDWGYQDGRIQGSTNHQRYRDGFSLTDSGVTRLEALDQAHYCIWCHHQEKDTCSKGMPNKITKGDFDEQVSFPKFQQSSFQIPLTGCPLEEKISEMNEVKAAGYSLGALAIIVIDNPMVAATGHRICNDCMKSCIYQKQDPVSIPDIETQILTDVLELPWGFEIYSLLTRWNPLNFQRPCMMRTTGRKVLVVGMGPAGFTLAHHLLNDGHTVVGIDGLKIEPLDSSLSGIDEKGNHVPFVPISSLKDIQVPLDQRIQGGFGGVAEYGITARWDKNYLTIIRLLLERRETFALFGGVRFGGTLTIEQALELGFDHIALCMGAGSPTVLPLKNAGASGVRQASDFLMALQLTGASKRDSLSSLQIDLPAVVIGGGLTAIDTATEVMAYYPLQVERFYHRYHELCGLKGERVIRSLWSATEQIKVDQFLDHGTAIVAERQRAIIAGEKPNFIPLVQSWGGVTLLYRRDFIQSPSYRLNHEEVAKGLEEGICVREQIIPLEVEVDEFEKACALRVQTSIGFESIPARSIFVAAGTKPNINLVYDEKSLDLTSIKQGVQTFQAINEDNTPVQSEKSPKPIHPDILMKTLQNGRYMSFFGDMHPSFAGNVVKAMASAKQGYPIISRLLKKLPSAQSFDQKKFFQHLNTILRATVYQVNRLTPSIVEVIVKAPQAAKNFRPGQFFRLQNYETLAPVVQRTKMAMEGIALTGAEVNSDEGTVSTIVLEMGGSSQLCQFLKPGEPVIFMGPTGEPTEIPNNKTVLLMGGGLGNAVLFSIGQAMRDNGCSIIYFAGYKKQEDRFKREAIESAADQIVWCCDEAPGFTPSRPQDLAFVGNIVEAVTSYAQQEWNLFKKADLKIDAPLSYLLLEDVEHLLVIGSDRMMAAIAEAQQTTLKPYLQRVTHSFASINSPMQCMMKEICAQCIQRQVDPTTGEEKIVYSCVQQDQPLQWVDFGFLSNRLAQNSIQEKLNAQWVELFSSR